MKARKKLIALLLSFILLMGNISVPTIPTDAAASVTAKNAASGVSLTWSNVSGVAGYYVYRGDTKIKTIKGTTTRSYVDESAKNGITYKYKIVPYTSSKKTKTALSTKIYRLSRPTISSISSPSAGKLKVAYSKNSKAKGYQIQYSNSSKFSTYKTVSVNDYATVSKTVTGLANGKTYYVRVRSLKTLNNVKYYSAWSSIGKVTIKNSTSTGSAPSSGDVYITPTGKKYHSRVCGSGNYSKTTLEDAKKRGLTPCAKCY